MKTRKANQQDQEEYEQLKANSEAFHTLRAESQAFYANGAKFEDDFRAEVHKTACEQFEQEREDAGFYISQNGLRIITQR